MTIEHRFREKELVSLRTKHFYPAIKMFKESNDALGMLLRIHLVSEGILEELIRIIFDDKSEPILSLKLTYKQKLDLVSKIRINDDTPVLVDYIVGALRKLNGLRNKLAHNLEFKISPLHVFEMYEDKEFSKTTHSDKDVCELLETFSLIVLPGMLPYFEDESGKVVV